MEFIRNLRNTLDYFLREKIKFSIPVPVSEPVHGEAAKVQKEFQSFLSKVQWSQFMDHRRAIRIADVGARTFSFGPVYEWVFKNEKFARVDVHGFEIDAFRRFTNLRSRADYGRYYAAQLENGFYHPMDFIKNPLEFDFVFLLNPFVTLHPLMSWGLPKSKFQPQRLFEHCKKSLRNGGYLVVSAPNEDELKISTQISEDLGFKAVDKFDWHPSETSIQKQPRLSVIFK